MRLVNWLEFTLDKSILLASDNPLSVEKYYDLFDYNINRIQDDYNVILLDPTEKSIAFSVKWSKTLCK